MRSSSGHHGYSLVIMLAILTMLATVGLITTRIIAATFKAQRSVAEVTHDEAQVSDLVRHLREDCHRANSVELVRSNDADASRGEETLTLTSNGTGRVVYTFAGGSWRRLDAAEQAGSCPIREFKLVSPSVSLLHLDGLPVAVSLNIRWQRPLSDPLQRRSTQSLAFRLNRGARGEERP